MKSVKALSLFLIGLLIVGALSMITPAYAATSKEITDISAGLGSDSGMIASATELAGADSDLVKEFQLGVKYGEFAARLYQGDYWGVAADFAKFQLGRAVDKLTDLASKKFLSAGAQHLVGVFTALKDTGIWLGNKALDMQFNEGVKAGYEAYKANVGQGDYVDMMHIWWTFYGTGKMEKINDKVITKEMWLAQFAKIYAIEKKAEKAPVALKDIVATEKAIKKVAIVHFFKLKYPGIGSNVSEELADAIVNKADPAVIKQIAERYKKHFDGLTAKSKSDAVSSGGICGVIENKDDRKDCEKTLAKIVNDRNRVFANEMGYPTFFDWTDRLEVRGVSNHNLTKFIIGQQNIIASAYEFQFGQEIRAINLSLATNKVQFDSLMNGYQNLPEEGDHGRMPFYEVSVDKGTFFAGTIKKGSVVGINYGSFGYHDFEDGVAQKYYQKYLANEPKANVADQIRARYLEVHIGRLNGLIREFTILQNRINSLVPSAESAWGVFSYGDTTVAGLKKMIAETEELKEDIQSGGKYWKWRNDGWNINSISGTLKEMESDKKARKSLIDQMKKDYASVLKTYTEEKKQRKLEERDLVDSFKKAAAEREAQALQKKKAEEKVSKQELALHEAEKQAAIKKSAELKKKRIDSFNVPFEKNQKPTPSKSIPTTKTAKPAATKTKPTLLPQQPSAKPSAQKKSTLPFGFSGIPNENVELSGFSFIAKGKADMGSSDFFWTPNTIYSSGGLDLGSKPIPKPFDPDNSTDFTPDFTSVNAVTSVPTSGYENNSQFAPAVGHVYAIKTRGGNYGIIQIQAVHAGYLYFTWRYQPNGSTSFP